MRGCEARGRQAHSERELCTDEGRAPATQLACRARWVCVVEKGALRVEGRGRGSSGAEGKSTLTCRSAPVRISGQCGRARRDEAGRPDGGGGTPPEMRAPTADDSYCAREEAGASLLVAEIEWELWSQGPSRKGTDATRSELRRWVDAGSEAEAGRSERVSDGIRSEPVSEALRAVGVEMGVLKGLAAVASDEASKSGTALENSRSREPISPLRSRRASVMSMWAVRSDRRRTLFSVAGLLGGGVLLLFFGPGTRPSSLDSKTAGDGVPGFAWAVQLTHRLLGGTGVREELMDRRGIGRSWCGTSGAARFRKNCYTKS